MLEKLQKKLQETLEKLTPKLNELRDKIPLSFLKRKKEEEEEAVTSSDQTTELSASDQEAQTQVDSESVEEVNSGVDATKAEKKKKFIRIAVISLAIIYLAVDQLFTSSDKVTEDLDPVAQERMAAQRKKNKEEKEAAKKAKEEKLAQENVEQQEQQQANPAEIAATTETTPVVEEVVPPSTETANPVAGVDSTTGNAVTDTTTPAMVDTPAVVSQAEPTSLPATEPLAASSSPVVTDNTVPTSPTPALEQEPAITTAVAEVDPSVVVSPSPASLSPGTEENSSVVSQNLGIGEDLPKEEVKELTEKNNNLENALGPKAEEIASEYTKAEYNLIGRGLVYNCKGKHWACVARDSWFKCKNNEKWSSANSKDKECKTIDVYASEDDCRTVQINNINTRKETSFCK